MRRYIVNFKGNGYIIFHSEYTNYHTIDINLSGASLGRPGNNFFTEGETKTFELAKVRIKWLNTLRFMSE